MLNMLLITAIALLLQVSWCSAASISVDESYYLTNEDIDATFSGASSTTDWIGIYYAHRIDDTSGAVPSGADAWQYVCGGQSACSNVVQSGSLNMGQMPAGSYRAALLADDGYQIRAISSTFLVDPAGASACTGAAATTAASSNTHAVPVDQSAVSKIAFSSCFKPNSQSSATLWNHVRSTLSPVAGSVWLWLGDNMYADGESMELKRLKYNEARNDQYYSSAGPIGSPKIATTGTWDDHDYAANNQGSEYKCRSESQAEFAIHFNLPLTDARHPDFAGAAGQQLGVYSANMFVKDGTNENGIHLIKLDTRYHRDPTFASSGVGCYGAASTMLGDEQWAWLEAELQRPSEIKVIASPIQVLPATHRESRSLSDYCAYDSNGNTFDSANAAVGEDASYKGTQYESWAEMPQQRTRLLQLAQQAINTGNAKKVVFVSGDQHWAEIMAKKMPTSQDYGAEQTLYEVTASGIDQNWPYDVPNSNRIKRGTRLRPESCDHQGSGATDQECIFPFNYGGVTYDDCTTVANSGVEWCSTMTDAANNHVTGNWGNCKAIYLTADDDIFTYSDENTCSEQDSRYSHVCSATANYGGIQVDWPNQTLKLSIYTPHEQDAVAAELEIDLI